MKTVAYDRGKAVTYARRWAFGRNPAYYNFNALGGDCTNFASQCLYAGCGIMNFTPTLGWYYLSANERTASWTGVEFFYNFLVTNAGTGPFAEETDIAALEIGDFVQLGRETGDFYHTAMVSGFRSGNPLLAAHTFDALNRPLNSYSFEKIRCLHIEGARSSE